VMAFATLPSPLYGLYRTRDHLSAFVITVIFAIFAAGTITTLLGERFIAARAGRRGAMLGGVATMMVAAGVLAAWKDLPGLLIGRVLTGVAIGPVRRAVRTLPGHHAAPSRLQASRVLALGMLAMVAMVAGLVLLVVAVQLSTPSLALFLIGGALIGAGAGAVYKGTTGLVHESTGPDDRVAMTSDLVIAVFVGLSPPVIGAGVALDLGASAPDTVFGFAILAALAVAVSGWALLGRQSGAAS
jgi:Sugar (and other) transporter